MVILIQNGRLVDPLQKVDAVCDILIENGVIKEIGAHLSHTGATVIDASGLVVAPGLVDVHVHFREPGFTYKEDIQTGAKAAARGGVTTVVCMANTKPVIDSPEVLQLFLDSAKQAPIRVKTVAAVSKGFGGKELTDMKTLKEMGAAGFSDDGLPIMDTAFLREALLAAKELDMSISLHEEDVRLIGKQGVNDGAVSQKFGFQGAPKVSESAIIARDCMIALDTGGMAHMQHLSCAESVAVIRLAKQMGAKVTCEVTPQHFTLTEASILEKGTLAKLNPPLRTEVDKQAMIDGLKDGTIDMIVTDHAPHSEEEKSMDLDKAPSGLTGLETSLAVSITNLVKPGHLTLMQLIEKMSLAPCKLYGFDTGHLSVGAKADVVIFDEGAPWVVKKEEFVSKSSNSPFIGDRVYGKVKYTICGGDIVYQDQ